MDSNTQMNDYIHRQIKLEQNLINFIEKSDSTLDDFFNNIDVDDISNNWEHLILFLRLLLSISNNHHRHPSFFKKIEQILLFFRNAIVENFSNYQLFNFFKENRQIILFLISERFIYLQDNIFNEIVKFYDQYQFQIYHFLYPEIKPIITKESQESQENFLINNDVNIQEHFDENRKIGENDLYLCSLIRNDSYDEFIIFINQKNLPLNSTIIKPSIFETNLFLLDKKSTLIEYASFYGSIQIFNYLRLNKVKLNSSLWLYSIHGQNPEIINILEENHIEPPSNSYELCFEEALKCHHNEIADYIMINYLDKNESIKNAFLCSIINCNFSYFPEDICLNNGLFYLQKYNYNELVNIYLETKKKVIEKESIFKQTKIL